MIIDCHGHYTTSPKGLADYRKAQLDAFQASPSAGHEIGPVGVSDDEIRLSLEENQLRLQRERGLDFTIFSPGASQMGHHLGNEATSVQWSVQCNNLIRRACELYPKNFAPVCQLPQSPGASIHSSVLELRRCVEEMGFIGCNFNPDPSGGYWNGPTLDDKAYWPLYEALCELNVPAMIHVSAACNPSFHSTGSHYLNGDTTAFMQALTSGIFRDFPNMKWVIPHGGGAVPYHWGRFKGMSEANSWQPLTELMENVYFDTCVYHQAGIDLLLRVVPTKNVLFASEMLGAVKGADPDTGAFYDDTRRYIENAEISDESRTMIFEGNVRKVYPRLRQWLP